MSALPDNPDNTAVVHEESDVNVRTIFWFGAGLALVALVLHVFLWWLQGFFATTSARSQTIVYPMAQSERDRLPPEPRLQDNPQQALRELRAKQQALLDGFAWVDKGAGVARIPIEEAMRTIVRRGLPTREAQAAGTAPDVSKTGGATGTGSSKADSAGRPQ
jgi:hypothetical protein